MILGSNLLVIVALVVPQLLLWKVIAFVLAICVLYAFDVYTVRLVKAGAKRGIKGYET